LAHDAAISASDTTILNDLKEWYKAMRQTRSVLLHCLAIGLGMSSSSSSSSSSEDDDDDDDAQSYFNNLHQENNDALRLIKYHPGDDTTGNRCKEHSDYGTITLLLNDGIAGLEAHVNGKWRAVPYVEGSIVVNVGTLLSEWTRQELKATLHRVAGPASSDSCNTAMEREVLMESVRRERISIAYFADPDVDVSVSLSTNTAAMMKKKEDGVLDNDEKRGIELMSVSDYIRWRSGGSGQDRSGVAFTSLEESRLGEAEGSGAK
jgi:isopenicillin N synthase-like dioxygenase